VSEGRRIATRVVLATLALLVAIGVGPVARERILAAYVLALAAIALAALTRILRGDSELPPPSEFERALRPQATEHARPPELIRIEREIRLGLSSHWYLHRRLAPILRDAATARGVDFERRPDAARALLGDELWELVRPGTEAPDHVTRSPLGYPQLRAAVERLEAL
jgi:hypothetical protein